MDNVKFVLANEALYLYLLRDWEFRLAITVDKCNVDRDRYSICVVFTRSYVQHIRGQWRTH